jgi:hypothetical protein
MSNILDAIRNGGAKLPATTGTSPHMLRNLQCESCGKYVHPSDLQTVQVEVATGRSGDSVTFVGDMFSYGKRDGKRGGVRYNTGRTYYKIQYRQHCSECRNSGSGSFGTLVIIVIIIAALYYFFKGDSNEQAKRLPEPSQQSSSTGLPVERRQEELDQEKSLVASREFKQQVPGQEENGGVISEEDRILAILNSTNEKE